MAMITTRCAPLFRPSSIAVVGVSATNPVSWGRITVERLARSGFAGEIVAVASGPLDLPGVRVVGSLAEIGYGPGLVVLATPAAATPALVREARELGAGAAVVYASGFAEEGDTRLQDELRAAAGEMPVLGPNCLGVVGRPAGVQVSTTVFLDRERSAPGPVGIVAQSGAMGFVLADLLEQAGVGYSYYASVGNEACLTAFEVGSHLLSLPDVEVLVLYLEGVRDAAGLRALGEQARAAGKHVVALATGRSDAGRRAALSHTAAVAGDHLLLASLCRDAGIQLVADDEQVVDAVLCARRGITLPPAPRLAVLTMSGGAGGVIADELTAMGVRVPALSPETRAGLAALGAVEAGDANPVDLGGNIVRWLDRVEDVLGVLDADPDIDGVVLYLTFGDRFPQAYHRIAAAAAAARTPTWFVWACGPAGEVARTGKPETVLPSIAALVRRLRVLVPDRVEVADDTERHTTPARIDSELRAAPALERVGIAHVDTVSGRTADELAAAVAAAGWPGPFVLKGDAADVPHRARYGLVRVGVTAPELPVVAHALAERLAVVSTDPERRVVAQPLLPHGAELALGAVRDPVYGTAVLLGAGGDRAEDPDAPRRALLLPADDDRIGRLAAWAHDVLGAPLAPTATAVRGLVQLLAQRPDVAEVDVNPLCVTGTELVAVDALITYAEENGS